MSPDDPRHGKVSGYKAGCNNPCCKTIGSRAQKQYRLRRARMGGATTVPATHAAETIKHIHQRMSYSAIARALGTSHNYITKIVNGDIHRISPQREQAILNLHNYQPTDTSHVNPLGAQRRLRALYALGYTYRHLDDETGYGASSLKKLMGHNPWPVIEAKNDKAIRDAYDRLSMRLPTSDNLQARSGITRARNYAKRNGWAPPLAWDDIDNPDAEPHGVTSGYTTDINATRVHELEHFASMGYTLDGACDRLCIDRDSLWKWASRHGHLDLYERLSAPYRRSENGTTKGTAA